MKKFFLIIVSLCLIVPATVSAGSCECRLSTGADTIPDCTLKGIAKSTTDCSKLIGTMDEDAIGTYDNCVYFSNDNCQNNCQAQGLTAGDFQTETCQSDNDCERLNNGIGVEKCCESTCYFDAVGLQAYENSRVGNRQIQLKKPELEIRIPGVSFTDVKSTLDSKGYIYIPYIGEYIAALYKFALVAASILAVIVIIMNGFRIVISAGGDQKNEAFKKVGQAIIGLVILWGSYTLFYTINPELTQFKALKIKYVEIPLLEHEEEVTKKTPVAADAEIETPFGANMAWNSNVRISNTLLPPLKAAALELRNQGIQLYITSGLRTKEKQIELINQHCNNPPGSSTCNPKTNVTVCMLKDMRLENCPHTTGKAVDVWGKKNGSFCVDPKICKSDPNSDPCRKDPCQNAVIQAMKNQGFCNLQSEAWHFELPQMSTKCI